MPPHPESLHVLYKDMGALQRDGPIQRGTPLIHALTFSLCVCVVLGMESRDVLPLSYTPSPFYFEIGSCLVATVLSKASLEPEILLSQPPKY